MTKKYGGAFENESQNSAMTIMEHTTASNQFGGKSDRPCLFVIVLTSWRESKPTAQGGLDLKLFGQRGRQRLLQ